MKEKDLLSFFKKIFSYPHDASLPVGPGDDCAVMDLGGKEYLLATVDEIQQDTHFIMDFSSPELLAAKLVRMNVSDIYSMGAARPLFCFIAGGLPKGLRQEWVKEFAVAARKEAGLFNMKVAGGNLCRSDKIHFSMTVIGLADKKHLVLRTGARQGDIIAGVGAMGEARAGLEILIKGKKQGIAEKKLVSSFWRPEIKQQEAGKIARFATAMLDNSDGLFRSLEILAQENGLKAEAEIKEEMVSKELRAWCSSQGKDWRKYALAGGEDYGLIFTAGKKDFEILKRELKNCYQIGEMKKGKGVSVKNYGSEIQTFEHF